MTQAYLGAPLIRPSATFSLLTAGRRALAMMLFESPLARRRHGEALSP
jgi:hypothetical protein